MMIGSFSLTPSPLSLYLPFLSGFFFTENPSGSFAFQTLRSEEVEGPSFPFFSNFSSPSSPQVVCFV